MEINENDLKQIATGYWPPHLGVLTDAEKIQALAEQLIAASDSVVELEDIQTCEECDLCGSHG